jgi:NodT family efflux transporter outer membrane factor (OMF) lipoprotein
MMARGSRQRYVTFLLIVLPLAFFVCSGCLKVGPDYVRPEVKVADTWLEAADARLKSDPAATRRWWQAFRDPVLDQLIEKAYRENLDLRQAGVRVLEAQAQLGVAVGRFFPQTQELTGSIQRSRTGAGTPLPFSGGGASPFPGFNYWQAQFGLNIAWELDFWGKFRRGIEAAEAGVAASLADYDAVLVSLTASVANLYTTIRTLERRLAIARNNVATQQESLAIAEARFAGGVTSQRDVEQARSQLTATQSIMPVLQTQLRQAQDALCVLLGQPPQHLPELAQGQGQIPRPPLQVAAGIPAELLRRRPDIRAAEYNAMAQCALIGVAKADLLPAFSLTGNFGFQASDMGRNRLGDIGNWPNRFGAVGPSVRWPILNYGRLTNLVRVQDARFQELLLQYQNTVLKAQQEVEDNLAAFLRGQEQVRFLTESVAASQKSLDLAVIQYREGITDFTTVLTAQQALLRTQESLAEAQGAIATSLVGVYRALGGGWELREGQDLIPAALQEEMGKRTFWGTMLKQGLGKREEGKEKEGQ